MSLAARQMCIREILESNTNQTTEAAVRVMGIIVDMNRPDNELLEDKNGDSFSNCIDEKNQGNGPLFLLLDDGSGADFLPASPCRENGCLDVVLPEACAVDGTCIITNVDRMFIRRGDLVDVIGVLKYVCDECECCSKENRHFRPYLVTKAIYLRNPKRNDDEVNDDNLNHHEALRNLEITAVGTNIPVIRQSVTFASLANLKVITSNSNENEKTQNNQNSFNTSPENEGGFSTRHIITDDIISHESIHRLIMSPAVLEENGLSESDLFIILGVDEPKRKRFIRYQAMNMEMKKIECTKNVLKGRIRKVLRELKESGKIYVNESNGRILPSKTNFIRDTK